MLHACYGKLSKAARARSASAFSKQKYSTAMVFMVASRCTAHVSTKTSSSPSLSLLPPSTSHPSYLRPMHDAASQQGMIHRKVSHFTRLLFSSEILSRDDSMLLEKASNGSFLKHKRLFSSIASSSEPQTANSSKLVVVVESSAKAKAVQSFLGSDFVVLASHGHVRELAARAGSIRPEDDFAMLWEVPEAAKPHVAKIKNACKSAQCLVLATDPDREGEALAWHVAEVMKAEGLMRGGGLKVQRVLFCEITKRAVLHAMQAPQGIRKALVNAYMAQRALDYLVGFTLAPLLWRKLAGSRSAGRVHLAALQLICEREKAIEEFGPEAFWTLDILACFANESTSFSLQPLLIDNKKLQEVPYFSDKAKALALAEKLEGKTLKVSNITKRFKSRDPPEPYITSTLQEDAEAMLGFDAVRTMTLAQKLYEGINMGKGELTGLITYPRTDGLKLTRETTRGIRAIIAQRFGNDYILPDAREFSSKVRNTEEAHEAIRPTDVHRLPSALGQLLDKDALLLYTLIWKRTVECQMAQAMFEEISVDFISQFEAVRLRTTVSQLTFPGFIAAFVDKETSSLKAAWPSNHPDYQNLASESWDKVSGLREGDILLIKKAEAQHHLTSAPSRYSEGKLVKAMKQEGIGRPSTYVSTLKSLEARKYVRTQNQQIIPEIQGRMVSSFLCHYLPKFVDRNITALLEKQLDEVAGGRLQWTEILREFWPSFHAGVASVMNMPSREVAEAFFNECFTDLGLTGRFCPRCGTGKLSLKEKRGFKKGYQLVCNNRAMCRFKGWVLDNEDADEQAETHSFSSKKSEDILLGVDPSTNLEVRVRTGPFGSYIQLGSDERGLQCFKFPPGVKPGDITMEKALQLMKYPKELGKHPEGGRPVILGVNEKSYFVKHQKTRAAVPEGENVDKISLKRALQLLRARRKAISKLAAEDTEKKGTQNNSKSSVLQKVKMSEAPSKSNKNRATAEAGKRNSSSKKESLVVAAEGKAKKPRRTKKKARSDATKEAKDHAVPLRKKECMVVTGEGKAKKPRRTKRKARSEATKEEKDHAVPGTAWCFASSRKKESSVVAAEGKAKKPRRTKKKARSEAAKETKDHAVPGTAADGGMEKSKGEDTAAEMSMSDENGLCASAR